jgi:UDP-2,4-diacetamido-2,4,6-trideoxy-beta-L-altropyranose hydrolase
MPKLPVFIRTDASPSIGLGHLIRTSALADMLSPAFEPTFILQDTPAEISVKFISSAFKKILIPFSGFESDKEIVFLNQQGFSSGSIFIVDGYQFEPEYHKNLQQAGFHVVCIDDLVRPGHSADLIINQADFVSANDYKTNSVTRFCLGPRFALLRQPFLKAAQEKARHINKIQSVFVSFGGADTNNITFKVVNILSAFEEIKNVHILSSSVNANIDEWKNQLPHPGRIHFHQNMYSSEVCQLMQSCELAICPSSSLSLELCAVGILLFTGTTAGNQEGYYKSLIHHKTAIGIGNWLSASENEISEKLSTVLNLDEASIQEMTNAQRIYIDGLSGQRLLNVFLGLAK